MNLISFSAAIVMTITLTQGFFVLYTDYKSEINRLFFILCCAISIWLLGGCFGYSSPTRDEAFFWERFASLGYIPLQALGLHFISRYTGAIRSRLIYLLYLPSLVFIYSSLTGYFVFKDIYRSGKYWVLVPGYYSFLSCMFLALCVISYTVSLVMLYFYAVRTGSIRIRKQSRLIFAGVFIIIILYAAETFLAPAFLDYKTYGQAPVYSVIWLSIICYAMVKYRFLGLDRAYIAGDILNSIMEMIIITDIKKNVILTNRILSERLGSSKKIRSLDEIFTEYEMVSRLLDMADEKPVYNVMLNLVLPVRGRSLVRTNIFVIRDRFNDTVGFIIAAQDVEDLFSLFMSRGITEREYELIKLVISGNSNKAISGQLDISLRTVETHITNIYNKLGLKNRSELINYCSNVLVNHPG